MQNKTCILPICQLTHINVFQTHFLGNVTHKREALTLLTPAQEQTRYDKFHNSATAQIPRENHADGA